MSAQCQHVDNWFSRTICECGSMHYFCTDCGKQEDPCRPEESPTNEVRVTSDTGGSKNAKTERHDLIPTHPLKLLAEHYGRGAAKYEPVNGRDNWRNGYDWSLSYAALNRHLRAFWSGEDVDEETGSPHVIAAAWHCFTLAEFMRHPEFRERFDDRQDPLPAIVHLEPAEDRSL